jgi:hypothetical protein
MFQRIKSAFLSTQTNSILLVIAMSLLAMISSACLLQGHKFIYIAPILLLAVFGGLYFKPPTYYLPLCVGFFLGAGLYVGLASLIEYGCSTSAVISLLIGLIGFALVLSSLWQFMFGEWQMPVWYDKTILGLVIFGTTLIIATFLVAFNKDGGDPTSTAPVSHSSAATQSS